MPRLSQLLFQRTAKRSALRRRSAPSGGESLEQRVLLTAPVATDWDLGLFSRGTDVKVDASDIVSAFGTDADGDLTATSVTFGTPTVDGVPAGSLTDVGFVYTPGAGTAGVFSIDGQAAAFAGIAVGDDVDVVVPFTVSDGTDSDAGELLYEIDGDLNAIDFEIFFLGDTASEAMATADDVAAGVSVDLTLVIAGPADIQETLSTGIELNVDLDGASGPALEDDTLTIAIASAFDGSTASATAADAGKALAFANVGSESTAAANASRADAVAEVDSVVTATATDNSTAFAKGSDIGSAQAAADESSTANALADAGSLATAVADGNSAASANASDLSDAQALAENGSAADSDATDVSSSTATADNSSVATANSDTSSTAVAIANDVGSATAVALDESTASADATTQSISTAFAETSAGSSASSTDTSDAQAVATDSSAAEASASNLSSATSEAESGSNASATAMESSTAEATADLTASSTAFAEAGSTSVAPASDGSFTNSVAVDNSTTTASANDGSDALAFAEDSSSADAFATNESSSSASATTNTDATAHAELGSTATAQSAGDVERSAKLSALLGDGGAAIAAEVNGQVTGTPGIPISLPIDVSETDDESLDSIVVSGLPAGSVLTAGTPNGDGSEWTFTTVPPADLEFTTPSEFGGQFDLVVTGVIGDDFASGTQRVTIAGSCSTVMPGDGANLIGDTLYVAGTDSADKIRVIETKTQVKVKLNRDKPTFDLADVANLVVCGFDGADKISRSTKSAAPAILEGGRGSDKITGSNADETLVGGSGSDKINAKGGDDVIDGGDGNDKLNAGAGDDIVFAGSGNDMVSGSKGQDLLFGDDGRDVIKGGSGEDILIAGSTDLDLDALQLILAEWTSGRSYEERVANISGDSSSGVNVGNFLTSENITDTVDGDKLVGGCQHDWFFANATDVLGGRKDFEELSII